MFAIPNPKKEVKVNYSVSDILKAIERIPIASYGKGNYRLTKKNPVFNQITLERMEGISLGVYVDFNLSKISENETSIEIEIRRKIGAFDTAYEIDRANDHIQDSIQYISDLVVLNDSEFQKAYESNIKEMEEDKKDASLPWYAQKNILKMWWITSIVGFFIFPPIILVPIIGQIKKSKWEKQKGV